MQTRISRLAAMSAVALLGTTGANASIINAQTTTGSEVILSVVDPVAQASYAQDLGLTESELRTALGDGSELFSLDSGLSSFISGAGGLASVTFAIIGGGAINGTSTAFYLHSSANDAFNSSGLVRANVLSKLQGYTNALNTSTAADDDVDGSIDYTYGPNSAAALYYQSSQNYYRWGLTSGATWNTLGAGDQVLSLYGLRMDSTSGPTVCGDVDGAGPSLPDWNNLSYSSVTNCDIARVGSATLDLVNGILSVQADAVVPVPTAVWLFGSGLGLLSLYRRRQPVAAA